ncbi:MULTISPECIES: hypothetical protein [unclassified Variovorax]|uniref:hypothetical protein n=1 Tax=unclassified Variovorax TaxID=663243 RepID=UPI00076BF90B|nr:MULTISPECIES: hypothetical protein [unclassified Variovorax]KWT69574.1 hypothetical protein APY03_6934 [Variovorax sp. WDL1]PNG48893.1 hypothetical protein CHC06_06661 [Variovorax sp. B2]PNG49400.1 hypothetical protein CHC07_06309 [Variovorax sp. B4]VTV18296.1 hypothetical protein WDL1P2_00015 [Variovorax sp. WDL1]
MAIVKANTNRQSLTFISLVERTNKHLSAAEVEKNPELKVPGFLYKNPQGQHELARQLSGSVVSVKVGTDKYEPVGQPAVVYPIATVRLTDGESVKIRLDQQLGRTVIGLLAANALSHGDGPVDIYVSHVRAGDRIGNGEPFDRDRSFISVKPEGAANNMKFAPIYAGEDGQILVDGEGKPAGLPKAKTVRFQGQDRLDWEEINNIAVWTAAGLESYYKDKDAQAHTSSQAPDDHEQQNDGIDLNEAAAAAAPRG